MTFTIIYSIIGYSVALAMFLVDLYAARKEHRPRYCGLEEYICCGIMWPGLVFLILKGAGKHV